MVPGGCRFNPYLSRHGLVAQWIEQLVPNQQVTGSNPVGAIQPTQPREVTMSNMDDLDHAEKALTIFVMLAILFAVGCGLGFLLVRLLG